MADSTADVLTVRTAILDTINDETYTNLPFTAKAAYLPEYMLQQLASLQVDVRIVMEDTEVIDRMTTPSSEDIHHYEITVQMAVDPANTAAIDALMNRARRIAKLFPVNLTLTDPTPDAVVVANNHELYDQFYLREYKVFYSRIELAVRQFATNT